MTTHAKTSKTIRAVGHEIRESATTCQAATIQLTAVAVYKTKALLFHRSIISISIDNKYLVVLVSHLLLFSSGIISYVRKYSFCTEQSTLIHRSRSLRIRGIFFFLESESLERINTWSVENSDSRLPRRLL